MIAALVASGILQPLLPVLAAGTAAGENISNTATATYADDAGTTFNATSNTVQIVVAPISGVTVKPTGITDKNTGAVEQGDTLEYNFDVKNVGNTAAEIFIPVPTVTNFAVDKVEYLDDFSTPARVTTPVLVTVNAAGGTITGVASDKVVKVIVTGKVPTTGVVAGDLITVRLGNTGSNDNGSTTQNVVEADNASTSDVRTAFTLDPQGITNPVDNKEASATQSIPFATKVTPQAFSLLKKTVSSVTPGTSLAGNDDTINYKLNFSVLSSSPNGALSPAALEGTKIKVGVSAAAATETTKILVSDAIPAGTVLKAVPTSPSTDWKPVYSTDSVDTTIPIISSDASALPAASWSTTNPSTPAEFAAVKRVGFIYDPSTPIAVGATPVDFFISVVTSGLPVNGGKVYNIAQSFGETVGDTANKVVVDESGDASPSNFEDTGNAGPAYDPAKDTGKADPATQGVDTKGDNSGVGTKGEDTEVTITGTIAPASDSILNGPNGKPDAVGPTDANDDFTNASTPVPAGQSPSVKIVGTQIATFTNSVSNPSTVTLADVTIQPLSPTQADKADNGTSDNKGQYGTDLDIPLLTEVKVTELLADGITPGTKTATYVYTLTGTVYTFEPKVTGTAPVNFGSLAPNATVKYKTEVTLPDGSVKPLTAVAIPMVAFPDDNPSNKLGYTNELTNNITLDRVYTGYMKLVKEARILSADKNTIIQDWTDAASGTPAGTLTKKAAPGQFIEYRISYQNISTAANGSGNVILNAKNFKLIEDGTAAIGTPASSTNNWGTFTTHQQNTLASQGTVSYFSGAGLLVGTTDQADGNDVGKYENVVPTVAPAGQGTFQFRRVVK
jgi:hypothetical protein